MPLTHLCNNVRRIQKLIQNIVKFVLTLLLADSIIYKQRVQGTKKMIDECGDAPDISYLPPCQTYSSSPHQFIH